MNESKQAMLELADKIAQAKDALDHMTDGEPEGLGPTEAKFFALMEDNCETIVAALRSSAPQADVRAALKTSLSYIQELSQASPRDPEYKSAIAMIKRALSNPPSVAPEAGRPVSFLEAMNIVERGFDTWKDKPHNARWYSRIDGTPIPNDLKVNIAEAICHSDLTRPQPGGEPTDAKGYFSKC